MTDIKRPKGHVVCWIDGAGGSREVVADTHNTTTYSSADALAAAYAGHPEYMPNKIAFVYGANPEVTQATKWSDIVEDAGDDGFKVTDFSYAPSLKSSDDSPYSHNIVVFHGRTQGVPANAALYKACLLGPPISGSGEDYNLLAVVDLGTSSGGTVSYREKLADYEFSIDWAVTFN